MWHISAGGDVQFERLANSIKLVMAKRKVIPSLAIADPTNHPSHSSQRHAQPELSV